MEEEIKCAIIDTAVEQGKDFKVLDLQSTMKALECMLGWIYILYYWAILIVKRDYYERL